MIFVAMVFKPFKKKLLSVLDERTAKITKDIEDAKAIRMEAQALLKEAQAKTKNAAEEASNIIKQAEREVQLLLESASKALEISIEKRTAITMQKISNHEDQLIRDMNASVVERAINVIYKLIEEEDKSSPVFSKLIENSLGDLRKKLN